MTENNQRNRHLDKHSLGLPHETDTDAFKRNVILIGKSKMPFECEFENEIVTISDSRMYIGRLNKKYALLSEKARIEAMKTFKSQMHSYKDLLEDTGLMGLKIISSYFQSAVDSLVEKGLYTVTMENFLQLYSDISDYPSNIENIIKPFYLAIEKQKAFNDQRKSQQRVPVFGGGIGISGFIKGAILGTVAGYALNGINDIIADKANSSTMMKTERLLEDYFKKNDIAEKYTEAVQYGVIIISISVITVLTYADILEKNSNPSDSDILATDALLTNLEDGKIPKNEVSKVIAQALRMNPFNPRIYKYCKRNTTWKSVIDLGENFIVYDNEDNLNNCTNDFTNEPTENKYDQTESSMRILAQKYKSNPEGHFYTINDIPVNKISNFCVTAKRKLNIDVPSKSVLVFFDETVFGSGKEAVAVNENYFVSTVGRGELIALNTISNISIEKEFLSRKLTIMTSNKKVSLTLTQGNDGTEKIVEFLRDVIELNNSNQNKPSDRKNHKTTTDVTRDSETTSIKGGLPDQVIQATSTEGTILSVLESVENESGNSHLVNIKASSDLNTHIKENRMIGEEREKKKSFAEEFTETINKTIRERQAIELAERQVMEAEMKVKGEVAWKGVLVMLTERYGNFCEIKEGNSEKPTICKITIGHEDRNGKVHIGKVYITHYNSVITLMIQLWPLEELNTEILLGLLQEDLLFGGFRIYGHHLWFQHDIFSYGVVNENVKRAIDIMAEYMISMNGWN